MKTVACGFFDGVHLGHQAILSGADVALTFRSHPLAVLAPDRAPPLLMPFEERMRRILACGVRSVRALDFTRELADMDPTEFARRFIMSDSGTGTCVACGENWRFGRAAEGNADWLRRMGCRVRTVPFAMHGGSVISSTRIRMAIERGEVDEANAMLGRPFTLQGCVRSGKGMGRTIGRPTVNLQLLFGSALRPLALPHGVYAVMFEGCPAVANYGVAPTAGERRWATPVLEVHCLAAVPAFGGRLPTVAFRHFIRPERTFDSLAALARQIDADCVSAIRLMR